MPKKYLSYFHSIRKTFRIIIILILNVIVSGVITAQFSDALASENSTFQYGFKERVRQTYLKNAFDLEDNKADDTNFIRVRSQLWGEWEPVEGWKLYTQVCNEHRHWFKSTKGYEDEDFKIDELILENLYIAIDRIGGSILSIKVGRQNIMYGESFLMMDGGPLDGSRTGYFNALRLKAETGKKYLEFHLVSDPTWDKYMPVLNSQHKNLIENDEKGAGVYYVDNSLTKKRIEGYYFYKCENYPENGKNNIHTTGARLSGEYSHDGSYAAEFALQLGDRFNHNRIGMGGYAHASYGFSTYLNPAISAGLIYLSGDNPKTDEYEGWNPLYSRWPKWSSLYIYPLASFERGVAYWENLIAVNIKLSVNPIDNVNIDASLYYMKAPENSEKGLSSPIILGTGDERGLLSILKLKWAYTDYLSGHLLWEHFIPGDYYLDGVNPADFLRCELSFKY